MRTIIAGLIAAGLVVAAPFGASAGYRRHFDEYAERYPSATPYQLKNLRAHERGEYYEQLLDAVPFGSRAWWEIMGRQGR
jgi:hypothetical protein